AGSADSNPTALTMSGGHLFFTADDGVHGTELWDPPVEAAIASTTAGDAELQRELAAARQATAKYHNLDAARADGFVNTGLPCIEGQGLHYINPSWIGTLDVEKPQILVYAPGDHLVALEWFVPASLAGDVPPTLFGQTFHGSSADGFYFLHVWAWEANPNGMFADTHPRIHCDAAAHDASLADGTDAVDWSAIVDAVVSE